MTTEQILQAVGTYLVDATGASASQVIAADAGNVRPRGPYLTVQVVDEATVGLPDVVSGEDGDGGYVEQVREFLDVRISVHAYGGSAVSWLAAARAAWRGRTAAALALREAGVSPQRWTPLRDLTAFRDTGHEPHAQADLLAYVRREHTVRAPVDVTRAVVVDVDLTREEGVSLLPVQTTVTDPREAP